MKYPRGMTLIIFASSQLLSACSMNGAGFASTRVDHGDGALISSLYAPGMNLRFGEDAGLSLGMTKRVCIQPLKSDSPAEGVYYLYSPVTGRCLSKDLTTGGVEVRTSGLEYSVTMGYRKTTILVHEKADTSLHYIVQYDPDSPGESIVRKIENGEPE